MNRLFVVFGILSLLGLTSCGTVKKAKSFATCDFKFKEVSYVKMGNLQYVHDKPLPELTFFQIADLTQRLMNGSLQCELEVLIDAKNPNSTEARLLRFDWQFVKEQSVLANGMVDKSFQIPALGESTLKIPIQLNVSEVLKQADTQEIKEMLGLVRKSEKRKNDYFIKIKPSLLKVGKKEVMYPGFIKIKID